jgi:hypothetical protein
LLKTRGVWESSGAEEADDAEEEAERPRVEASEEISVYRDDEVLTRSS